MSQLCLHLLTVTYLHIVKHFLSLSCRPLKEWWWRSRRRAVYSSQPCLSTAAPGEKENWQPSPCLLPLLHSYLWVTIAIRGVSPNFVPIWGESSMNNFWSLPAELDLMRCPSGKASMPPEPSAPLFQASSWQKQLAAGGQWVPLRGQHLQVTCSCPLLIQEP